MSQLVIMAEAEFDPGRLDRVRASGNRMVAASRREPGCITYAYSIDLERPNLMRVIEVWESSEALAAHMKTPHMATFRQDIAELGIRIVKLKVHELGASVRFPT